VTTHALTIPDFVEALLDPRAYPDSDGVESVRMAETHVSWLFFTGRHVYKVKKPVDFGFLDFTTLERRHHFCREEVRLNRRVSPDVYEGVSVLRQSGSRYAFGKEGEIVDYAVRMRQLPADRWLADLLESGDATPDLMERIARRIADFHRTAETGPEITRVGGLETVHVNTRENFEQTSDFIGLTLSRETYDVVRAYTESTLEKQVDLFRRREAASRIRDCHGDLHAAQICIENGISIIDCIEFNERFRFSDVAADIAFLAMDLDFFERPDLSELFVTRYAELAGDAEVQALIPFYKTYRAYTRGKVESLRVSQMTADDPELESEARRAERYFDLAREYGRLRGPLLIITSGLMGTGKSTLARALGARLGATVISSDRVRKESAGLAPGERRFERWGEGIYSANATRRVYETLHRRAAHRLAAGEIVIVDASYRERGYREAAARAARHGGAGRLVIEVTASDEVVRKRLIGRQAGRGSVSDGRLELLDTQRERFDPHVEVPDEERIVVDTSAGSADSVAFQALKMCFLASPTSR
jgi:aminoglycoside phosphotransferase family enzyme/predicted kinase